MAAGVLLPMGADAQLYDCVRPPVPFVPYALHDRFERERAEEEIAVYADQMQAYLDCLAAERESAEDEATDILERWSDALRGGG